MGSSARVCHSCASATTSSVMVDISAGETSFVIHTRKVPAQQVMHPAVAKPTTLKSNINDSASQGLCLLTGHGWVAQTVSAQPHKSAGGALGELKLLNHLADRLTLDLWG